MSKPTPRLWKEEAINLFFQLLEDFKTSECNCDGAPDAPYACYFHRNENEIRRLLAKATDKKETAFFPPIQKSMRKIKLSAIQDEITVCPYCMNPIQVDPHAGCCGEVHSAKAYDLGDEIVLVDEVEVFI